jgi:release factor glutamine methyltransferase
MTASTPETVLEFLQFARKVFAENRIPEPRLEAELLLAHALGCDRVQLYVRYDQPLSPDERRRFGELLRLRGRRVPVQYILGYRDFWTFRVKVEPGVLIPRPETECLIEEVVALHKGRGTSPRTIADVGTGTGCLAIAMALEFESARVFAGDIADKPLELAPLNAAAAGVDPARLKVFRADGLAGLRAAAGEPFELVVSNPPYITEAAFEGLQREVREHEPREALVSGVDGLDVIRAIARAAAEPGCIVPGGAIFIEIGDAPQVPVVRALLHEAGFRETGVRNDYAGLPRVVFGIDHDPAAVRV